jgi:SpoVK/Ycf46/Vps4 family AAA+-type ATPase
VTKINVVIAASPHDVQADGIRAATETNSDLSVVGNRVIALDEIARTLATIPRDAPCALILVGAHDQVNATEARWLAERSQLVVLRVEVIGDIVRIGLHDPNMKIVLDYLRELVERAGRDPLERVSHLQLPPPPSPTAESSWIADPAPTRPVLHAAIAWIQATLRRAGLNLTNEVAPKVATDDLQGSLLTRDASVAAADAGLSEAIARADINTEPLAVLMRRLELTPLEFRLVLLALSPELDVLYQRCYVDLLGETGRHVGSLALYAALMGDPVEIRQQLAVTANLEGWCLIEGRAGQATPAADEPLRLDSCITQWLLGDGRALEQDIRLRRVLRRAYWPGASVLEESVEIERVANQLQRLQQPAVAAGGGPSWLLFNGDHTATWHALLERAARLIGYPPLRVQVRCVTALDTAEIIATARRLTRLAKLSHRPILLDAAALDASADNDDALRLLLGEVAAAKCRAGIICTNVPRYIGLLGTNSVEIVADDCLPQQARRRNLKTAAQQLGLTFADEMLDILEQQVPLQADGWERAVGLTRAHRQPTETRAQLTKRFIASCRDVAAETISDFAVRLDPHCELNDVVLPEERKQLLQQIVHGVRFARRVLDEWNFGEQLAYGRGVTALFHGPSGTGKTMSALGVARALGSQVLRIDLSRVVSKYIGETEKHIDVVFRDAAQCGAVLLIDEADALLGKRSEVRDAHDRYANIEVSYLLQRIESYDGVAIFTTNARQAIDPAFLRRLRFIIEFPRPDAVAREDIWRRCLPANSHTLKEADFRRLARKIDMTGGHIRQITLQAAFLAAAAGETISLDHIRQASRAELAKLGLPPVSLDVGEHDAASVGAAAVKVA